MCALQTEMTANIPLRDTSADEQRLKTARVDLAAALRFAAQLGLHEGVCNHFSLAVPLASGEDAFWINPQGIQWLELVPSDLVLVDVDGHKLAGKHSVEPTAFFIHGRVHTANKRARCIMHTHMPYATALTLLEDGCLEWVSQNSLRFYDRVAYDTEYRGLALDDAEGDRICSKLADANVMFMANHGVLICAENAAYAFDDLYYLERACLVQVLAQSTGKPLRHVSAEVAALTARQFAAERQQSSLHFEALKKTLSIKDPHWLADIHAL
jgi:ribulose-5-phosphate 4-epimerase/fuculose-1-phosphate aldolase